MSLAVAEPDPYQALGVTRDASLAEVKRAFRQQAKLHHPDLNPKPGATARMARINEAYALLSDPPRRALWDAIHPASTAGAARTATTAGASPHRARGDADARSRTRAGSDLDEALAFVLTFGKHRGRSLRQVADLEPGYIAWMARSLGNRPDVQRHARIVLAHLEAQGWRDTPRPRRPRPADGPAPRRPEDPAANRAREAAEAARRPHQASTPAGSVIDNHAGAIGLGLTGLGVLAWMAGISVETVSGLVSIAAIVVWPLWILVRDRGLAPDLRRGGRTAWTAAFGQVAMVLVLLWIGWGMLEEIIVGPQPGDIVCEVYDLRSGDCVVESVYEGP
jgi:curved DNA-binding protein CbpA